MTGLDTLLDRLRTAAAEHASPHVPELVPVRSWPPATESGARKALQDAWVSARSSEVGPFLVTDLDAFVDLAFMACLGRPADPVGRGHYLGRLRAGVPRLEVLAELAGSPESARYRGKPPWPLWFRPITWGLRLPSAFLRRATRVALRRIEGALGRRARRTTTGLVWSLAGTIDERDRFRESDVISVTERVSSAETRLSSAMSSIDDMTARLATMGVGLDASSKALTALRARVAMLDYASTSQPAGAAAAPASRDELTRYYLTLESVFRGDPDRIRAQLETDYLHLVTGAREQVGEGSCVDLGCGRGEWLDVLAAHGFAAQGVDLNPEMAKAAAARGHNVMLGDALTFLHGLPADSVLAISGFHLAEHLDFASLFGLVAECRRVLKPLGLLILETPNPENVWVATHTFHHDPTHRNPLTPASLEFLVNHHGLETVAVLRLHPYPPEARLPGNDPVTERLNGMTCGGQDFAVIAKKTPVA